MLFLIFLTKRRVVCLMFLRFAYCDSDFFLKSGVCINLICKFLVNKHHVIYDLDCFYTKRWN